VLTLDLWGDVVASLEAAGQISNEDLEIYFRATSQLRYDRLAKRLVVRVPNRRFSRSISHRYGNLISTKLEELSFPNVEVVFRADLDESQSDLISSPQLLGSYVGAAECNLNQRYTFGNFVVGSSNQFAHAAALAVAARPARSYNPLYLYGGVGLGKTHLMHAIGHSIKIERPNATLAYVPSEQFTNELVSAIRYDRTAAFRKKYRNVDVLLMDDVQFLAGKPTTKQEFFHTFNSLYDAQKQIVITSDSPPQEISTLEERVHSRFQWGLIADIQAPDLETKVAILRKKAALQQIELPNDVAYFISSNTKSNIRELEGSLTRVLAYARLVEEPVTPSLVQSALASLDPAEPQLPPSPEVIIDVVCRYFGIGREALLSKSRAKRVAYPRQLAMYLIREMSHRSLVEIGAALGGRDHSTVHHGWRKMSRSLQIGPETRQDVTSLRELIDRARQAA